MGQYPIRRPIKLAIIVAIAPLTGCVSLAFQQNAPVPIAQYWHATLPHDGKTSDLVAWWGTFHDPALTTLQLAAETSSPDLATAWANIQKARATLASARAGFFPSLTGTASATRSGTEGDKTNEIAASTTGSGGMDASWEIDLFGKLRRQADAAAHRVAEEAANWHDARVSLAAEVADYYVQYRACRQIERSYSEELASQRQTIRATQTAAASGLTSSADLALAQASAASSSSTLTSQTSECEVLIKTLAELTGGDEPQLRIVLKQGNSSIPSPSTFAVRTLPADMVRQRPDVVSLERELAATAAEVGVAQADFYPSLSLGGSITINQSSLTGTSIPWSFGPSLSIPVFDQGQRRAAFDTAVAGYQIAFQSYRSGILGAVSEVETALIRIDATRRRIGDTSVAAKNYRAYFAAIDENWRAGGASLLDREEARRSAQSAEISLIEVRRDAVRYWIALYKALGGGWGNAAAKTITQKVAATTKGNVP
ncbi:RND efflux system, outer membrane lipoprotein, NodT family [Rhizobium sp. CF080]|uniref:efflux transporter outer membrane subunit n=1 Tax=Rhizobium sp. (strain CF080) TaxID=1144310 RepID=UPI000271ACEC|nr:efflux transporter outer membrane subunit [Rhizobium sp. CF080]EUB99959.1 RND efflux system, outer membrane lipoprotein, NodT family [Rhizobium sp. CF080]